MMTLNFGFDFMMGLSRLVILFSLVGFGFSLYLLFASVCDGIFTGLFFLLWFIVGLVALFGIFFLH
jgi:hypothetical protein